MFWILISLQIHGSVSQTGLWGSFFYAPEVTHSHQRTPLHCFNTRLFSLWSPAKRFVYSNHILLLSSGFCVGDGAFLVHVFGFTWAIERRYVSHSCLKEYNLHCQLSFEIVSNPKEPDNSWNKPHKRSLLFRKQHPQENSTMKLRFLLCSFFSPFSSPVQLNKEQHKVGQAGLR